MTLAVRETDLGPRIDLCVLPTPLQPMERLAEHLGMSAGSLWVKRDDLTGLATGGNKARKLEYLCAEALAQGADTLVTAGGLQSNHCRQTAAAAARLGLSCTLVLSGERPQTPSGNVLLDKILGADAVWPGGDGSSMGLDAALAQTEAGLRSAGKRPYVIPVGGSNEVGALGYVNAARELMAQDEDLVRAGGATSNFELVVLATGSCGTHGGLVAGLGDFGRTLGVRVGERAELEAYLTEKARITAKQASLAEPRGEPEIVHDQLGAGYGAITEACVEAINLAARLEGLLLDPVYTGKAMAGLIASVRSGRIGSSTRTVFLHTGGTPGLFAQRYERCWETP